MHLEGLGAQAIRVRLQVALAVSSKGGWVLAAQALEGNPYDGHTLQARWIGSSRRARSNPSTPRHGLPGPRLESPDPRGPRRRGSIAKSVWRWMKRRAAIEPSIRHLKEPRRMERCRLKGTGGDKVNPS